MRIKPTKNRVLILTDPDCIEEQRGVAIPDRAHDFVNRGAVIAIGPHVEELEVGDVVHFNPHAPQVRILEEQGRSLVLIRERNTNADIHETVAVVELEDE